MNVEILPEAEADLLECFNFYEDQNEGAGRNFVLSLYADIDRLRSLGGIHAWAFGYQQMIANKYPHAIYYKVVDGTVQVWAIIDCRRDPDWIKQRLSQ